MRNLIHIAFFMWLSISAGMVWVTNDMEIAGKISRGWLCLLAFFGGITGMTSIIHRIMTEDD